MILLLILQTLTPFPIYPDFSDLSSATPTSASPVSTSERLSRLLQHQKQLKPSLLPLLPTAPSIDRNSGLAATSNAVISSSSHSVLDAHLRLPELRARLARLLEAGSSSTGTAAADNLKRRLDIPAGLLEMVASHVIQEAEDEPYGLNGE